jgi:hypothetical protein
VELGWGVGMGMGMGFGMPGMPGLAIGEAPYGVSSLRDRPCAPAYVAWATGLVILSRRVG